MKSIDESAMGAVAVVRKRQLHASPTNPRKELDEAAIEEMAASIRRHGIIQPLIVRRWPGKDRADEPAYEIVCGHRRFYAASRVEELERVQVIVRVMSDVEVREVQLIENLQREDVSPYDEAVGYAALLELVDEAGAPIYSVERIADKIGKGVGYVRNRLKMRRTPKRLLDALRKGLVGTRICELVGRIPHAEDRERCAAEVLEPMYGDGPMSVLEAQAHIRDGYMVPLSGVPFDRAATDLIPAVGSCEACPLRSGNDPDLEEDLAVSPKGASGAGRVAGIDPWLCLSPSCYRAKAAAHMERVKREAADRVMDEAEAKRVFDDYGNVRATGRWKLANRKPDFRDVGHWDSGKLKPWGVYAERYGVPVVLARNPRNGEIVELVDAVAVKEAEALAAPAKRVFDAPGAAKGAVGKGLARGGAEGPAAAAVDVALLEKRAALLAMAEELRGVVGRAELLELLGALSDHEGVDLVLGWMGLKVGSGAKRVEKVAALVEAAAADAERYDREGLTIACVMAMLAEGLHYHGLASERFARFALPRGVTPDLVRERARALEAEMSAVAVPSGDGADGDDGGMMDATRRAIAGLARSSGSVLVSWGKIAEVLGLGPEEQALAQRVEAEMRQLGAVKMGVLDRESAVVRGVVEGGG